MEIFKLCALAVLSAVCCMVLKKFDGAIANSISIVCIVALAAFAVGAIWNIADFVKKVSAESAVSPYLPYIWKSVGVMFITEYGAEICEEAGEGTLAKALCIAGRVEITLISLPLFSELLQLALSMTAK